MLIDALTQQNIIFQLRFQAPALAQLLIRQNLLTPCIHWLTNNVISIDWMLHLRVLAWLPQDVLSEDVAIDCLRAAAIRWGLAGLEHPNACGILLSTSYLPEYGQGLWKNQDPLKNHRLVSVRLTEPTVALWQYAISYQWGNWQNARWFCLPEIK